MGFLAFIIFIVVVNELILKKIAKQPRPDLSCNLTCGFPSGHSTMSIGFFVLLYLDASFRVMPKVPVDLPSAQIFQGTPEDEEVSGDDGMKTMGLKIRDWRSVGS